MINYAQEIKDSLKMIDVLSRYGFEPKQGKRLPCPIHQGQDNNFSFKDDCFKCFSCGASGDVISFVMQYFNLSFREAIEKINCDFSLGLPIGEEITPEQRIKMERSQLERQKKQAERDKIKSDYDKALSEWCRLDKNKVVYAPKSPDEPLHPLFIEAVQGINQAYERLSHAASKLSEIKA